MLDPVSNKVDFSKVEKELLHFWEEGEVFKKSLELRRDAEEFVFYDGPPFATGLPHYGHLLAGTIKDIVPRYQTMRGYYVERRFGWDCHGLPVEYEIEQELNLAGKRDIERIGVATFNEKCCSIVLRYTSEWRDIVTRMGRWVDFDNDYKTMDPPYMESIWWVFKTLWDKKLIYEGQKILPYCPRCATPLSNFETNLGYAETRDPAITVRIPLRGAPDTYILAWTTTPWTLPSNLLLAVGADVVYAKVRDGRTTYILAEDRLSTYYREEAPDVIERVRGEALVGLEYDPLFDYFSSLRDQGAFRVVAGDFVTTEDGTGVVHVAPGFGEDDNRLATSLGVPTVCPVDGECRFTPEISDYEGRAVKETDADIMERLKAEGRLVHREQIVHNYPHCWRCDHPLIYRAISTWFVAVEQIRDRLLAANAQIHWVPGHLKEGRFGRWLENARDWAISRNRYWGTPLPVWRNEDGSEVVCLGSMAELEERAGRKVGDLHKQFVDAIELPSADGKGVLRRVPEVLDCWFESGAMPYAQNHYPFENKERFEQHFPADFIAEGLDQTRGWFYTLTVLAAALFDRPAFRNVVVNGLILAEDGRKMSKRLKNYPDPLTIVEEYGADALRLYMINSPVVRGEDLCFSEDGVRHALRHFLIPWWNAYSFFVTYARIDGWKPGKMPAPEQRPLLDRWIKSALARLVDEVVTAMEGYDLQRAVRPFVRFIEDLTNWYIRRSRRRFWKSGDDGDKASAYATLYETLHTLCRVAAPFVPFISEAIYRNLRTEEEPESVHLCDFPEPDPAARDHALEEQMEMVIQVVSMGRQLRTDHQRKVRQPLRSLRVVTPRGEWLQQLGVFEHLIKEELNVRDVMFSTQQTELVDLHAKANFRNLGPKLGPRVKEAAQALAGISPDIVAGWVEGKPMHLRIAGEDIELSLDDIVVERHPKPGLAVSAEDELVVALDIRLDPELELEGLARELVNRVQQSRKDAGLDIVDRIHLAVGGDPAIWAAAEAHRDFIAAETLALKIERLTTDEGGGEELELNGKMCRIRIEKAGAQ